MVHKVWIPFEGEGSGVEVLSWGQRELWGGMQRQNTWMPLRFVKPLAAGTTLDDVVNDLRFLMARYQTLRTRLRFDPDGPKQVVSRCGEIPLEVVDVADDADPAAAADQVGQVYWDTDYDFVQEWPLRMAVVRHRGALTHLVSVMCHLVIDAVGGTVMLSELADRDRVAASGTTSPMPPVAQARWQRSPAGQRQCEMVRRHWERILRAVPPRRFPEPPQRPRPRYWHASFTSKAIHLAVRALAARMGVAASPVLLAVFAVALARATGIHPVVTRVVVSNRFRPGLAETVSPITQTALLVVDVAGCSFDEVVSQIQRRVLAAYKYAYYDPDQLDDLIARVERERGERVDLSCFFNDRRLRRDDSGSDPPPTLAEISAALPHGRFHWEDKQDAKPFERLFVHVDDVPDTVALSLFVDTHHVSPADVEACARGMEEVAVAAAIGTRAPSGVGASRSVPAGTGRL